MVSNQLTPYRVSGALTAGHFARAGYNMVSRRIRDWYSGPSRSRRLTARRQQFARSRTMTMVRRRKGLRSGQGVTTQHDQRFVYKKRNMPRRMRRRWKKFKNKVLAVSEKDLGTRTVVFNASVGPSNVTAGSHTVFNCALYPGKNGVAAYMDDLHLIVGYENAGDPTAAAGQTVDKTSKFIFKSAILDLTLRNASRVQATGAADSSSKMEIDVYEITGKKQFTNATGNFNDLIAAFSESDSDTLRIGGAGTSLALTQRGVTPWDLPFALSTFGLKILKKTKYMVPNGDTITYQIRDPRRHVWSQDWVNTLGGSNIPNVTRWLLVIAKVVPGISVGSGGANIEEKLEIGLTRKYFYKVEGISEDRDRYVSQ